MVLVCGPVRVSLQVPAVLCPRVPAARVLERRSLALLRFLIAWLVSSLLSFEHRLYVVGPRCLLDLYWTLERHGLNYMGPRIHGLFPTDRAL